ncbi:sensor histidine kinase [Actinomadura decatromicini]|uniref:histidine kinase n=1 Tax=Actinomadura decatromicini TaxID=2604572 RepID=A0A5D3FY79_9ACTN|nr:ATP-binding protein [Actinomadura decatromicini]TYK53134.1 hybrid sensor histidine kinase/response regulator [Actinomadura decatromicini]
MAEELLRLRISDEQGVFAVRRAGRQVAAAVGLDTQDQVRVATALSEVGRELFAHAGEVNVVFLLDGGRPPGLVVELDAASADGADRPRDGDAAAARLLDVVEEAGAGRGVRLRKHLNPATLAVDGPALDELRGMLGRLSPVPALEELRTQNADLIEALEDVRRQREELRVLNAELEETNQGVMALYNELSVELEETNRGVVALYAELEEKTDQLREAGAAKNRFWANVSHELRTPVNGVIGLTRLLLDPAAEPLTGEQRHQISLIADAGETLLSLVGELLDMAKAEQGRLAPRRGVVRMRVLLRRLTDMLAPMAQPPRVELRTETDPAAPADIVTDEEMLTRILRNLLANGLKFTDRGEVRLTVRQTPDHLEFVVADTGVGIPPGEQERVFEEFYQVPGGKRGGTGLGLPYARHLAHVLGGDLLLTSEPGAGTTVTLRLPPHRGLAELGLGHVLVADADEAARRALRGLLHGAVERVTEVADGPAVRDLLDADPPGLVLLGPNLPDSDVAAALARPVPGTVVVLVYADGVRPDGSVPGHADAILAEDQLSPTMLADAVARARAPRSQGTDR